MRPTLRLKVGHLIALPDSAVATVFDCGDEQVTRTVECHSTGRMSNAEMAIPPSPTSELLTAWVSDYYPGAR